MYFLKNAEAFAPQANMTDRRRFVGLLTGGFTLALLPAACSKSATKPSAAVAGLAQPFLRIAPDGIVTVIAKHLDMGQGSWTGLATLVAEELGAEWKNVQMEGAPSKVPDYGNLAFGPDGSTQGTGGSTAMANSWLQYRTAGATARAMLVAAAAKKWAVPAVEITVADGKLAHASGKLEGFGAFAALAAQETPPAKVDLKNPDQFKLIGKSAPRLDSPAKSNGSAKYAIDLRVPGMKYAVIARSPLFGGAVASFDATAAKTIKGVMDVVQVPSGVAVVGDNTWAVMRGRDALKIVWDDAKSEKRGTPELFANHRALASKAGSITVKKTGTIAASANKIEAEFSFPYLAHATMEPMNALCEYKNGDCHVTGGIQFHSVDHQIAAKIAGLGIDKVYLHTIYAGGSFGRRANPTADFIAESIEVAKALGKKYPVLLQWTREDDMRGGYYRPMAVHKINAALGANGKIASWQQTVATQSIMKGTALEALVQNGIDPTATEGNAGEQYDIPNVDISWAETKAGISVLWWRSVGHTHNAYAKEVMMDMMAKAANADPLKFRLAHLEKHPRLAAVLKLAAEKAGWGRKLAKGRAHGIAVQESFGSVVAQIAEVSNGANGVRVHKVTCAVDCGTAINPSNIIAQMQSGIGYGLSAFLHGKITLKEGAVEQTNFDTYEVLRMEEMPEIDVHILPSTNPPSGVGEPGTPPIAPAVANALFALSGKLVHSLPLNV